MFRILILALIPVLLVASPILAKENAYTKIIDPKTKSTIFVFKTEKGDVHFNHDKHQQKMKDESCIPCHKTTTPTSESTLTKLDQRKAHYFCKGCHHKLGVGPTECHECHKSTS
jgi:hypothetical protein